MLERTLRPLGWLRKALAPLFVIARKQSYRAQIFLKCETAAKDGSRIRYGLNDASKLRRQAPPEREHDADADMWRLIDDRFAMCLVSNVKYGATDAVCQLTAMAEIIIDHDFFVLIIIIHIIALGTRCRTR